MSLSPTDFSYVCELVQSRSAIVLEKDKTYLVESRLNPLAAKLGYKSLEEMVGKMRSEPVNGVHRKAVEAMTTNETSFFRDIHPFDTLRRVLLPELIQKRAAARTLRIWCAASSSGQEPYTIALLLKDGFPQLADWRVEIIATDLSTEILEKARSGIYTQLEINRGLPAIYLVKYFTKLEDKWRIREDVRNMVRFQEINLAQSYPFSGTFDFIFIRNVMIYFDLPTKKAILTRMKALMPADGYLFLGCAETTFNIHEGFESVTHGKTVCYRKKAG
jgi:chemotaxis protein methyltransferase CheR